MRNEFVLAALVALLSVSSCLDACGVRHVEAQVPARLAAGNRREPVADTLTRAVVSEVDGNEADYAPMLSVLQYRADRVGAPIASIARAYCRVFRARVVTDRMRPFAAMPQVMPRNRRAQWASALRVVEAWLAGDRKHQCSGEVHHFGDLRGDAARARGAGWVRVDCGPLAKQGYWAVPR